MSSDVPTNSASFPSAHSRTLLCSTRYTNWCAADISEHINRYYYTCEGLALTPLILSRDYLKSSPISNLEIIT